VEEAKMAKAPSTPAWFCNATLPAEGLVKSQHADNIDEMASLLTSPEAKRDWAMNMDGLPVQDNLGTTLPDFVTRARAIEWTAHPEPDRVTVVAARPWAGHRDTWVVVTTESPVRGAEPALTSLAVVRALPGGNAQRIAYTKSPLRVVVDWGMLPEDLRPSTCDDTCGHSDDPAEITAFDFDAYADNATFGVRATRGEGYSGGFGTFESLTLVRVEGDSLLPILTEPTWAQKMLSCDWHDDQTREHEHYEGHVVFDVRPRMDTMADIALHAPGATSSIVLRWRPDLGQYGCR
jgi:hypothetical protein